MADAGNSITLSGSTQTVREFFQFALSSILYQRGVYPPDAFEPHKKYGLTVMLVKDEKLSGYLTSVLQQFTGAPSAGEAARPQARALQATASRWPHPSPRAAEWLQGAALQKVVLVITAAASKEVVERWTFNIQTDKALVSSGCATPRSRARGRTAGRPRSGDAAARSWPTRRGASPSSRRRAGEPPPSLSRRSCRRSRP